MTDYDLAGNPLPASQDNVQRDLAGNPLPSNSRPGSAPETQYDLAGNPLPSRQPQQPGIYQPVPGSQLPIPPAAYNRPPPGPASSNYYSQAGPGVSGPDGSAAAVARANAEERGNVIKGLGLGALIGIIGSIAVLKLLFYAHFGLSYLYIGVGYGIGYGIWKCAGRGGSGLATAAVGIMLVSLFIAHLVYAGDILNLARASGNADPGVTLLDALPASMGTFSFMHWICIAIGLAACWRGVAQQEG